MICHFGVSHATHWEAESGLERPHKEHVQVPLLGVGIFIPAAAKLNPVTGTVGGAGIEIVLGAGGAEHALGDGLSHVWHLDTEEGLDRPQREQIQASFLTVGGFIPAAAKSKPFTAGVGEPLGDGVSQATHLAAEEGFDRPQSEQVHVSFLTVGGFIPAVVKSNA